MRHPRAHDGWLANVDDVDGSRLGRGNQVLRRATCSVAVRAAVRAAAPGDAAAPGRTALRRHLRARPTRPRRATCRCRAALQLVLPGGAPAAVKKGEAATRRHTGERVRDGGLPREVLDRDVRCIAECPLAERREQRSSARLRRAVVEPECAVFGGAGESGAAVPPVRRLPGDREGWRHVWRGKRAEGLPRPLEVCDEQVPQRGDGSEAAA
eukprot:scaffold4916_cov28-Tisochrysis_lutea.AAC.9